MVRAGALEKRLGELGWFILEQRQLHGTQWNCPSAYRDVNMEMDSDFQSGDCQEEKRKQAQTGVRLRRRNIFPMRAAKQ